MKDGVQTLYCSTATRSTYDPTSYKLQHSMGNMVSNGARDCSAENRRIEIHCRKR